MPHIAVLGCDSDAACITVAGAMITVTSGATSLPASGCHTVCQAPNLTANIDATCHTSIVHIYHIFNHVDAPDVAGHAGRGTLATVAEHTAMRAYDDHLIMRAEPFKSSSLFQLHTHYNYN